MSNPSNISMIEYCNCVNPPTRQVSHPNGGLRNYCKSCHKLVPNGENPPSERHYFSISSEPNYCICENPVATKVCSLGGQVLNYCEACGKVQQDEDRKSILERLNATQPNKWPTSPDDFKIPKDHPANERPTMKDGTTITNASGATQSFTLANFHAVPAAVLRILAQCLGFGALKHGLENWRGIPVHENLSHAMNHINEWRLGDKSEPHLVNAIARLTFALQLEIDAGNQSPDYTHPDMDNVLASLQKKELENGKDPRSTQQ